MNVYDFDKTIYPKDSSMQFYLFNLRKSPMIFRYWPSQFAAMLSHYVFKKSTKTEMKTRFYAYFKGIDDIDQRVELFWKQNVQYIQPWYLSQKEKDDLIISASPEFLLAPVCASLGIQLIASRVDSKSGKTEGLNCYGDEKVVRFREQFPNKSIDSFYSDSHSDLPLAKLAANSYLVENERVIQWSIS